MANIGKWLAIIILAFLIGFMILIFFASQFLSQYITWTLGIIGLITAGTVIYIIINFYKRRR